MENSNTYPGNKATQEWLSVVTDKSHYSLGDVIYIELINHSDRTFQFGNTAYDMRVRDSNGFEIFGWIGGEAMTDLHPKQTVEFSWDQTDGLGNQVLSGTYEIYSYGHFDTYATVIIEE